MGESMSYCIPLFVLLTFGSVGSAADEAVAAKIASPKTTSDIVSPATPKIVNMPAGLVHALEDIKLSIQLGQEMAKSMPQEEINVALANEFQSILSYHMFETDDAFNILKKVYDTSKLEGQSPSYLIGLL